MNEWLNQAFQEHSVMWLILSATLGGLISLSLKFFFDNILVNFLSRRRELKRIVKYYSSPLLRTCLTLERRVNNFIRNSDKDWYKNSDYYKLSTLYAFGEFLAWIRVLEREKNFLEFSKSKKTKEFEDNLYGIFKALTSFAYFRGIDDLEKIDASVIPRMFFTAIGETLIEEEGNGLKVLNFTSFVDSFENNPDSQKWFERLDAFLTDINNDDLKWDRLIILQINLKRFLIFLDPTIKSLSDKDFANISTMKNESVKSSLEEELNKKSKKILSTVPQYQIDP